MQPFQRWMDQRYLRNGRTEQRLQDLITKVNIIQQELGSQAIRIKKITLPAITLLSPTVVSPVVWTKPMPFVPTSDGTYVDFSAILGSGTAVISNVTTTGLTVTTTVTLGISAGAQLLVVAFTA